MKPFRTLLLGACVLLAGGMPAGAREPSLSTTDTAAPGDSSDSPLFPSTPAGDLLQRYLNAMAAVGEDAESRYQEALRLIQQEPDAPRLLLDAYGRVPEADYFLRWQLAYALAALQQSAARPALASIAFSVMPSERNEGSEWSSLSRESLIRVAVVDGLAALARRGSREAESDVLELVRHTDFSVRQRAVRGYLAAGRDYDARAQTLRERLPWQEHWLITLDVTEVRTVPHPDDTPVDLRPPVRVRDDAPPTAR